MTNLRNPNIRPRDVRKLLSYKAESLSWDQGCDESSEWVFASLESEKHKVSLINWLESKRVPETTESVVVDVSLNELKIVIWKDILESPERYIGDKAFQLYDIDLKWVLEFREQQIVRFGRYS